jgi:hypothetical protein
MIRSARDKAVPIEGAKKSPSRHRPNVSAAATHRLSRVPGLHQPAHLLIDGAAKMDFRESERKSVSTKCFCHHYPYACESDGTCANSGIISVDVAAVVAVEFAWIFPDIFIEVAFACDVVIDSENVWATRTFSEKLQLRRGHTKPQEVVVHRMTRMHIAPQQIPRHPSPFVFEVRLITKSRCAECATEIFRLHQNRIRVHFANRAHGKVDSAALIYQGAGEVQSVRFVRVPVTIERAEARRRQWLVHRRVSIDPWVTARHARSEPRQLLRKIGVEQIGVTRAASVMEQPGYGSNA